MSAAEGLKYIKVRTKKLHPCYFMDDLEGKKIRIFWKCSRSYFCEIIYFVCLAEDLSQGCVIIANSGNTSGGAFFVFTGNCRSFIILGIITLVLHFWFFLENDNGRSNGNLIAFQSLLWPAFSFLTTSRICCMTIDPAIGWQ